MASFIVNSCLICRTEEDISLKKDSNKICSRFITLVGRFLNLEKLSLLQQQIESYICSPVCCFNCYESLKIFCDTYQTLERVQLEILSITENISKLLTNNQSHFKFRDELISKVADERRRNPPYLKLQKLEVEPKPKFVKEEISVENHENFPVTAQYIRDSELVDDHHHHDDDALDIFDEFGFNETEQNLVPIKVEGNAISTCRNKRSRFILRSCLLCEKKFRKPKQLVDHMLVHTGEKPLHCRLCWKEFSRKTSLSLHKKIHRHPNRNDDCQKSVREKHQCELCGKAVTKLKQHLRNIHFSVKDKTAKKKSKKWVCERCGKEFDKRPNFISHQRSHSENRKFSCEICNKSYKQPSHVLRHKMVAHNESSRNGLKNRAEKFRCPHSPCKLMFYDNGEFQRHVRIHTGEKPYKCDQCESAFTQKIALKRHQEMHSGLRSFLCNICGRGFSRKHRLTKHEKSHLKEKCLK